MANNIVQLTDYNDNNIYPIAGAAAQGSITKSMLEEGVFEGPELSEPSTVAYVATDNIQDDAVNSDKIDWANFNIEGSAECRNALGGSGNLCLTLESGTDLNTATILKKKSGFFMGAGLVNGPIGRGSTDWFYIINMVHNSNYTTQIAIPFEVNRIFYRRYYNASWGGWSELASGTIPTVNNGTLTIQKNGSNVATFTANSSSNVTANISGIPTVTLSTTDIGEGATLAANTLYGVYS